MSDAPIDRDEERHRLVAMAAAVPLWLVCTPLFLPFASTNDSLVEMADLEPAALAALVAIVFPPLFVGAVGLVRGFRRKAPGKWLFGIPAVCCALVGLGLALIIGIALAFERSARREPFLWVCFALILVAFLRVVRSFGRAGWERFTQLIGGIWLVGVVFAIGMGFSPKPFFQNPSWGDWTFLVGLSALAPLVAFAGSPRKA